MDSLTAKFVTAHPIGPLQTVIIELEFYRKQTFCNLAQILRTCFL